MSEQQQRCEKFQFWQNLHSGMNRPLGPSHHQSATTLRALLSTSSSPFSPSMSSSLSSALIVIRNAYIVICHICKWLTYYYIDHFFILITLIQISITRRGKSCGKAVLLHQNQLETTIIIVVWQTHPLSHSFFSLRTMILANVSQHTAKSALIFTKINLWQIKSQVMIRIFCYPTPIYSKITIGGPQNHNWQTGKQVGQELSVNLFIFVANSCHWWMTPKSLVTIRRHYFVCKKAA